MFDAIIDQLRAAAAKLIEERDACKRNYADVQERIAALRTQEKRWLDSIERLNEQINAAEDALASLEVEKAKLDPMAKDRVMTGAFPKPTPKHEEPQPDTPKKLPRDPFEDHVEPAAADFDDDAEDATEDQPESLVETIEQERGKGDEPEAEQPTRHEFRSGEVTELVKLEMEGLEDFTIPEIKTALGMAPSNNSAYEIFKRLESSSFIRRTGKRRNKAMVYEKVPHAPEPVKQTIKPLAQEVVARDRPKTHGPKPKVGEREFDEWLEKAWLAGWKFDDKGHGKVMVHPPQGKSFIVSRPRHKRGRVVQNTKAQFRRGGLNI